MKFKTAEPILVLSVQLFIRLTNNYLCLLSAMTALKIICILTHPILTPTLWGRKLKSPSLVWLSAALWTSSWSSSVHGIFQARTLEWVTISYSRVSFPPRDRTSVSCIGRQILYHCATWEAPTIYLALWKPLLSSFSLSLLIFGD